MVLGGFLVPTSDSYLRRKLGDAEALPLADRVEMCRRALADGPWDVSLGQRVPARARRSRARARARLRVEVVAVRDLGAARPRWATSGEAPRVRRAAGHTAAVRARLAGARDARAAAPESGLVVVEGSSTTSRRRKCAAVRARKWGELERSGDVHVEVVACLRSMADREVAMFDGDDT